MRKAREDAFNPAGPGPVAAAGTCAGAAAAKKKYPRGPARRELNRRPSAWHPCIIPLRHMLILVNRACPAHLHWSSLGAARRSELRDTWQPSSRPRAATARGAGPKRLSSAVPGAVLMAGSRQVRLAFAGRRVASRVWRAPLSRRGSGTALVLALREGISTTLVPLVMHWYWELVHRTALQLHCYWRY